MKLLDKIAEFTPEDSWLPLDELLTQLWSEGVQPADLAILFGVFERFPEDDGAGVLWSIVHGVEALPFDYEAPLRASLQRKDSEMGRILLCRLEKSRAATG